MTVKLVEHRKLQRQLGLVLIFEPSTRLVSLCYVGVIIVYRFRLAAACHPVLAALASGRRLFIQNKDQPALSHLGPI